ncbi:MAG TPA: hypothetical protein VKA83_09420 [Methylomirabilota bacterium]|nr:hypothetical protein [Methylomirabilota bacterium]
MAQFTAPKQLRLVVAMKPESVAGTDVLSDTYVSTDVIPVIQDSVRWTQDQNEIQNMMTSGRMGRAPSILGKLTARLDFDMYIRGKGAAYSASLKPELDLPLRGCGLGVTSSFTGGSEFYQYQPSDTEEVMTVYVVQEIPGQVSNLAIQMVGCLATGRMVARAGEPMRASFSFVGQLEERKDITPGGFTTGQLNLSPGFPTMKAAAFQYGGYAPRIANIGFDLGNTCNPIESINAAGGVAGFKIFDRNPRLQIDPELDRETASSWWAKLRDSNPLDDCTFQLGTTQYNRMKFRFGANGGAGDAQLQLVRQALGARDGLSIWQSEFLATISLGNDDYSLRFD